MKDNAHLKFKVLLNILMSFNKRCEVDAKCLSSEKLKENRKKIIILQSKSKKWHFIVLKLCKASNWRTFEILFEKIIRNKSHWIVAAEICVITLYVMLCIWHALCHRKIANEMMFLSNIRMLFNGFSSYIVISIHLIQNAFAKPFFSPFQWMCVI